MNKGEKMINYNRIKYFFISSFIFTCITLALNLFFGYLIDITYFFLEEHNYSNYLIYRTLTINSITILLLIISIIFSIVYFSNKKDVILNIALITSCIGVVLNNIVSLDTNAIRILTSIIIISLNLSIFMIIKLNLINEKMINNIIKFASLIMLLAAFVSLGFTIWRLINFERTTVNIAIYSTRLVLIFTSLILFVIYITTSKKWITCLNWIIVAFSLDLNFISFYLFLVATIMISFVIKMVFNEMKEKSENNAKINIGNLQS